jgi:predicted phage terminase large subunit-like protein
VTAPGQPVEEILGRIADEAAAKRAAEEADRAAWAARQAACDHRFAYLRQRSEALDALVTVFFCNRCVAHGAFLARPSPQGQHDPLGRPAGERRPRPDRRPARPALLACRRPIAGRRALGRGAAVSVAAAAQALRDNPRIAELLRPKWTKYIPQEPTPPQRAYLLLTCREAFYGGAAGGGKSSALLMAALQWVDTPGYSAMIFRRTFSDLEQPDALIPRSKQWLAGTDARWNEKRHTWTFPSGATLGFGYMENEGDELNYQGSACQFYGFDELTHFAERQYRYMFSRLRRLTGSPVPLRVRSSANPGGPGHGWVRQRFLVEGPSKGRVFVPAKLHDNPHLDGDEYVEGLMELDPVTRQQLLDGNWDVVEKGGKFERDWFEVLEEHQLPERFDNTVRYWDLAATTPSKKNKDPDYTAGAKVAVRKGVYYVLDVQRFRKVPADTEAHVKDVAAHDGRSLDVWMEQEPGSGGVNTIDHYAREVLEGYAFRGNKATGSKELRANPLSSAAGQGRVKLLRGVWNTDFLDEAQAFPGGLHDDMVDAVSGALEKLAEPREMEIGPDPYADDEF